MKRFSVTLCKLSVSKLQTLIVHAPDEKQALYTGVKHMTQDAVYMLPWLDETFEDTDMEAIVSAFSDTDCLVNVVEIPRF